MIKVAVAIIMFAVLMITPVRSDDFSNLVDKGNASIEEGDYKKALDYYHQAEVERPETPELDYNIGSALYKEGKYEEAVDKLQKSLVTEDIKGLFRFARDFGYQEKPEGYLSKCDFYLHIREHLVSKGDFKELNPKGFYEHL